MQDTRWGVLPLCRKAVGVFYSPSRLSQTHAGQSSESLTPLQKSSWCILQTASRLSQTHTDTADRTHTGQSLGSLTPLQKSSRCIVQSQLTGPDTCRTFVGESYPFAEKQLVYSTSPADWTRYMQDTRWGILPLCRKAVGVFYSPSRLSQTHTGHSLGGLNSLQKSSRCVLQPQLTGPDTYRTIVGESYPFAEK